LSATNGVAQELVFQPRVSLGYQTYEFDIAGNDDFDIETDYILGGLGLSVQRGRFFVDLYGQTNLSEAEDSAEDLGGNAGLNRDSEVDRFELNATLGYAVTDQFSAFGGLKYAANELRSDINSDDPAVDANLGDSFFDVDVEYFGPFIGASFAIPVEGVGAIALSASGAYLAGETTIDAEVAGDVIADNVDIDGNAFGFNFGAAWIGSFAPLSPNLANLGYTIGIDYSEYDFEDDGTDQFSEETLRTKVDIKVNF
jgi:hypothetical protein